MVCIMVGSAMFSILNNKGWTEASILRLVLAMMSVSMGVCCITAAPDASPIMTLVSFLAFLLLEIGIGMYFPSISFLRSQVIPESHRANVMNWFRVPMNCVTCGALLCLRVKSISDDKRVVFAFCLLLSLIGVLCCRRFMDLLQKTSAEGKLATEEPKDE